MSREKFPISLTYTSKEDPGLDGMQVYALPRVGDLIRTPTGKYKVIEVLFDNINVEQGCNIEVIISPVDSN